MGLIERYRNTYMASAQHVLGGEAKVLDVANVAAGPNPYMLTAGLVVAVLAVLATTGTLIGGPIILVAGLALAKPRFLILTDRGLVLFRRAMASSRMGALVGLTDTATLATGAGPVQLGMVSLQLGFERVWIRAKDLQRMVHGGAAPAGAA